MFSKTVIDSDSFLDMPLSTQALYFHLSMRADDEGFINSPKKTMRMIGCAEDDFKVLLAKKFLISFESGVIVIKHWKIHNYIRGDRVANTTHTKEKSLLIENENKSYSLNKPLSDKCLTSDSIGEYSIVEDRIGEYSINKQNFILPSGIDEELFNDFLIMRKKLKAPNTQRAIKLLINKLNDFISKGHNPNDILQTSYENGWKSFFEPRQPKQQPKSFKQQDKEAIDSSIDNYYRMKEQGFNLQEELIKQAELEKKGNIYELN